MAKRHFTYRNRSNNILKRKVGGMGSSTVSIVNPIKDFIVDANNGKNNSYATQNPFSVMNNPQPPAFSLPKTIINPLVGIHKLPLRTIARRNIPTRGITFNPKSPNKNYPHKFTKFPHIPMHVTRKMPKSAIKLSKKDNIKLDFSKEYNNAISKYNNNKITAEEAMKLYLDGVLKKIDIHDSNIIYNIGSKLANMHTEVPYNKELIKKNKSYRNEIYEMYETKYNENLNKILEELHSWKEGDEYIFEPIMHANDYVAPPYTKREFIYHLLLTFAERLQYYKGLDNNDKY